MGTVFERFLKKNLDLKILSLVLSALLWFFVHLTQTAEGLGQNQAPVRVPLTVENLAPALHVLSAPADVLVTVKGIHKNPEGLKPSAFKAFVDLEGKGAGAFLNLPVHIASPVGYVVTDVSPGNVEVVVDAESDKSVPVTWEFEGGKESGKILVTPREVVVKGPQSQVSRVAAAEIRIPDTPNSFRIPLNLTPVPIDILSRPVVGPSVIPETVRIVREETSNLQSLAIRPDIVGKFTKDSQLEAVSVNPSVILVELLSGERELDHLDTEPIDISGMQGTVVRKVKLLVPAGVKVHGDHEATVMILIGKRP